MAEYSPAVQEIDRKRRGIENAICDLYKEIAEAVGEGKFANDEEAKTLRRMQNSCVKMLQNAFKY